MSASAGVPMEAPQLGVEPNDYGEPTSGSAAVGGARPITLMLRPEPALYAPSADVWKPGEAAGLHIKRVCDSQGRVMVARELKVGGKSGDAKAHSAGGGSCL